MLLNHLPGYRQTKSGTTILAIGHKGLEKGITNGLGDARGVVPNANLNPVVPPDGSDFDPPGGPEIPPRKHVEDYTNVITARVCDRRTLGIRN